MRAQLEHAALMSYAATAAGGAVPRLRVATEVGPDSTLLAYDHIDGRTFDEIDPETVTDTDLDGVFRAVRTLHDERIVHRALSSEQLIRGTDGRVWVAGVQHGTIAASDVQERIDLAELLCTAALLTDAPRAVATGARVFGADRIVRALPALQLIALSPDTRRRMRKQKDVLAQLRDELIALRPSAVDTEQLELRRVKPRTLLTIVAGAIAAYVLLSQLANQDLIGTLRKADWRWALAALVLSAITFMGASLSLSGFVPEKLSHVRTFAAQLAAGFATLVSPPTVGAVAVNVRYLQKSGLHPALAAASVGVSQVFAFIVHIGLLTITAVLAGHERRHPLRAAACSDLHRRRRRGRARPAAAVRAGAQDDPRARPPDPQRGRTAAAHRRPAPVEDRRGRRRHPAAQRRVRAVHDRVLRGVRRRRRPELARHRAGLPRRLHAGAGGPDPWRARCRRGGVRRGPHPRRARLRHRRVGHAALPPAHLLAADAARATGASTGSSASARSDAPDAAAPASRRAAARVRRARAPRREAEPVVVEA